MLFACITTSLSRAVAVLIFVALIGLLPGAAWAQEPITRISFAVGGRANLGEMGDRYGFGYLLGGEAGYQPGILGLSWSVLFGSFESTSEGNIDTKLSTMEMDFSLRGRLGFGGEDAFTFVTVQAGVSLVRTSTPVPPDDSRTYFGPVVGAALEFIASEEYMISLGARYGMFTTGPDSVTVLLLFGAGSGAH